MGRAADRLLKLMYEWMEEAEECSSNLRGLARELESLREDCNTWETIGNTAAVVGSVLSICAVPFTGGASLAAAGAVAAGLGTGVSFVTKITEHFKSSNKLERVKEIDERCNKIADEIQELFEELRDQCPSRSTEERDKHVVNEFLKAMTRQGGLDSDTDIKDLDDLIKKLMDNTLVKTITKRLASSLITEVISVLSVFSLELEGKLAFAAVAAGGKQIGKAAAIKGASRFLGGVVGLAFSLPEAIDNWTKAIKDEHETEASKSLRDTSKKIDEAKENLSKKLSQITKLVKKAVNKSRPSPNPGPSPDPPSDDDDESSTERESSSDSSSSSNSSSSESSDEEERELKMALVNARSVNKLIRENDRALIDLILNNKLDVLLITETWLNVDYLTNGVFRRILPPNYNFLSFPRFGRGGGVAIVFNEEAFIVRHVPYHCDTGFEYVAASLRRQKTDEPVLILNIYRPKAYKGFFDELRALLSWAFSTFRLVIIGGDFNIHVDNPGSKESRDFQELLDDFGLVQRVSGPTHRGGHTLDLVIARQEVTISDLSVEGNNFSDHRTVLFTTNISVKHLDPINILKGTCDLVTSLIKKRKKKRKRKKRKRGKRNESKK